MLVVCRGCVPCRQDAVSGSRGEDVGCSRIEVLIYRQDKSVAKAGIGEVSRGLPEKLRFDDGVLRD